MSERRRDRRHFAAMYAAGPPPWEVGRPQPWVLRLADEGILRGDVLDAGCGTGENALALAARGCRVTGMDFVPAALAAARRKAAERNAAVEWIEGDLLAWDPGGRRFDAVLDCGFFHVLGDDERARWITRLRELVRPGGHLVLLGFSDREPGTGGPRRLREEELRETFRDGWSVERLLRTRFGGPAGAEDGPHAWLLVARRAEAAGDREGAGDR